MYIFIYDIYIIKGEFILGYIKGVDVVISFFGYF